MKIKSMLKMTQLSFLLVFLVSCGGKKTETADAIEAQTKAMQKQAQELKEQREVDKAEQKAAQAKQEALSAREKDEQKEKERKMELVNAPIKQGEFKLQLEPDPAIHKMFAVPVHIMTMKEAQANNYRSMDAAAYWKAPNQTAKKIKFGESGQKSSHTASVPFKHGDNAVVVITRIPGASQSISVTVLKREEDLSTSNVALRLSPAGLLPK